MDENIERLRNFNTDIQGLKTRNETLDLEIAELKARKELIKQKAAEHRSEVPTESQNQDIESAKKDIEKINADIAAKEAEKTENDKDITAKEAEIKKIQNENEENKRMDNTVLNFEKMHRAEILANAIYRTAFFKKLQGKELNDEESRSISGATGSGGAVIPTDTMNTIIGALQEASPMLSLVTVYNIPELISIPKENVVNDADWVAEDADGSTKDDTLTSVTLAAHKLLRFIKVTAKLETMSVSAFETWVVNTMVKKMSAAIDKAIIAGTGSGQPKGLDTATWDASNSITLATAKTAPTYDNLVDLEALIDETYINNVVFVMNRKTLAAVKKLQDTSKRPLFERIVEDGFRGTILGIPVKLDRNVKDNEVYLGDFKSAYVLNFPRAIEFATSKEAGFMSGSTVYRGLALVDGKPTEVKGAIARIKQGA